MYTDLSKRDVLYKYIYEVFRVNICSQIHLSESGTCLDA
jgi:hypothetical protein